MKRSFCTLLLSLLIHGLYAQTQHLITIADLKRLDQYADYSSFGSEVVRWNFAYKGEKKGKLDGVAGTQYRYVRPHPNPLFAEATASYWLLSDNSHQVVLTSDNKAWVAGLETAIQQGGFTLLNQKGDNKQFMLKEANLIWYLTWKVPFLFADTSPHTLTLFSRINPNAQTVSAVATQSTRPAVATKPTSSELPHLGGEWDTKYPPQNAADLFRAERQYAADYDKKHGKVGHTFFRVEKFRIQGKRTGQYRPLTDTRWDESFDLAVRRTGFEAFANERTRLYKQEALFDFNGERIWVPVQELLIKTLEKESKVGESITLYAVLVSYHDFGGMLHLSFLVNEFAAPATTDTFEPTAKGESGKAEKTTGQLVTTTVATPTVTGPSKSASSPEDFNTFIQQFSSDREFQLARIKFPLVWKEMTNDETIVHREYEATWKHYSMLKRATTDNFRITIKTPTAQKPNDGSVFITCRLDRGYGDSLVFKRIADKWYCVFREMMNG